VSTAHSNPPVGPSGWRSRIFVGEAIHTSQSHLPTAHGRWEADWVASHSLVRLRRDSSSSAPDGPSLQRSPTIYPSRWSWSPRSLEGLITGAIYWCIVHHRASARALATKVRYDPLAQYIRVCDEGDALMITTAQKFARGDIKMGGIFSRGPSVPEHFRDKVVWITGMRACV
jgi:hypothetical protein